MKLLLSMVLLATSATLYSQGTISKEEHRFITDYLKRTEADMIYTLRGIDERIWTKKSSTDSWSPAECAEHVLLAERGLMAQIKKALAGESGQDDLRANDAWLIGKISDRGVKVQTPLNPKHGQIKKEEVIRELQASRAEILEFLKDDSLGLRNHYGRSPYGKADVYQLLIVVAGHSMRHTAQIQEILNALKS